MGGGHGVGERGLRQRKMGRGELSLHADGVLQVSLEAGLSVDGETMRQVADAAWDFAPGRRPVLVDGRGARGMSGEAREVATTGQAAEWTSALAVVVESRAAAAVADLLLMLRKPPFPTRVFRAVEPAKAWLESQRH